MGHFNNVGLRNGELAEEEKYKEYLMQFTPENYSTPYIVKTMEDLPNGLSVEVIENDILANPEIKMVIIDGFNLMNHKGKDSNRNNMSNTSRQLRQLFGKYGVVGLVVHQTPQSAEKENMKKDEIGNRIVKPPEIHQYSETIAVIQDACTVLTFDQVDGLGKLKIVKARQPVVGKEIDLNCNFNYGFIEEVPENFNF
jgi:replicative DNA helicase